LPPPICYLDELNVAKNDTFITRKTHHALSNPLIFDITGLQHPTHCEQMLI